MHDADYERELQLRAWRWLDERELGDLDANHLRQIAATRGIDFATAVVYESVRRSPRHGPFIRAVDASIPNVGQSSADDLRSRANCATTKDHNDDLHGAATLVIVPGGFYREFPGSGADGRVVREAATQLGCKAEIAPVKSFGSLAHNARFLDNWLCALPDKPIILASLSKAGAEVKLAPSFFR